MSVKLLRIQSLAFFFLLFLDEEQFRVRLRGGRDHCSGRVEVLWNGTWGTLCDDHWTRENAGVVCQELGCGTLVDAPDNCFTHGEGRHLLGHVLCQGNEHFLYQCKRRRFNLAHPCNFVNLTVGAVCVGEITQLLSNNSGQTIQHSFKFKLIHIKAHYHT